MVQGNNSAYFLFTDGHISSISLLKGKHGIHVKTRPLGCQCAIGTGKAQQLDGQVGNCSDSLMNSLNLLLSFQAARALNQCCRGINQFERVCLFPFRKCGSAGKKRAHPPDGRLRILPEADCRGWHKMDAACNILRLR